MVRSFTRAAAGGLIAAAALALAAPGASAAGAGKAAVRVTTCRTGETDAARTAVFRASMRTIDGAATLAVRFRLQERVGTSSWDAIDAPGLDRWRSSKRGVGAFAYSQRVKALDTGSAYRVVVDYRWQAAGGSVLARATRRSAECRQGDPLPNLTVNKLVARRIASRPRQAQYSMTVLNRGRLAAPASNLRLLVDGSTEQRVRVPALEAGQAARVSLVAPRCGATMGAQIDPDGLVRESKETDNFRTETCTVP